MQKYKWEEFRWIKKEHEQYYKGIKIETMRWYYDDDYEHKSREYKITWLDNHISTWNIKKGSGLKELKQYIDYKLA